MTEEDNTNSETNVKSTIDAVTGLVKAIPVYQDALQPAAKEVGKSLLVVSKTVNIALAPIKALVWGYDKIEGFINSSLSKKLEKIPLESIVTPQLQIAGPTVEALRYAGHDENLRELYANLLATSMNKNTIHQAHPAYVDVIKGLCSEEAKLLKVFEHERMHPLIDLNSQDKDSKKGFSTIYSDFSHFTKIVQLEYPDLIPTYLNNLCRLGILEIPNGVHLTASNTYEPLENDTELNDLKESIVKSNGIVDYRRKTIRLTNFGKQFVKSVVINN